MYDTYYSGTIDDLKQDDTETCKNCKWFKGLAVGVNMYITECLYERISIEKRPDDFCRLFEKKEIDNG